MSILEEINDFIDKSDITLCKVKKLVKFNNNVVNQMKKYIETVDSILNDEELKEYFLENTPEEYVELTMVIYDRYKEFLNELNEYIT